MSEILETFYDMPGKFLEPDYQLPLGYNETYIHLMIRDPNCIFAYWELAPDSKERFLKKFSPCIWENSLLALRLFWNQNQEIYLLEDNTNNWYIHLEGKSIPEYGELGKLLPDNTFYPLAVSNFLHPFNQKFYLDNHKPDFKDELSNQSLKSFRSGISS